MKAFIVFCCASAIATGAVAQLSSAEKETVDRAKVRATTEGITVDPAGYDRSAGQAVYQRHLDEYIGCIRTQIMSGSIGPDMSVPNATNNACLYEFSLATASCGVYFGKYEMGVGINTTATSFCSLSYALARVKLSDDMKARR